MKTNFAYPAAFICYILWGISPVYWKQLQEINPLEVLCYRIIYSFVFLFLYLLFFKRKRILNFSLLELKSSFLPALAVSLNWGIYIWGINNGHLVASSIGYFISPIIGILIAASYFQEKLFFTDKIALCFVISAAAILSLSYLNDISLALGLAISINIYAVFKKNIKLCPIDSIFLESEIMLIPAIVCLLFLKNFHFSVNTEHSQLFYIIGSGPVTMIPLLFFSYAVSKIPLTNISMIQFTNPSIVFLLGYFVYDEPIPLIKFIAIFLVWLGIVIFVLGKSLKLKVCSAT